MISRKIYLTVVLLLSLLGGSTILAQTSIRLSKVPKDDKLGEKIKANLGNSGFGTRVDSTISQVVPVSNDAPKAVSPDTTSQVDLPTGNSFNAIDLPRTYSLNRIYFKSYGAAGTVRVLGSNQKLSPDDPNWKQLFPASEFGSGEIFDREFPDANAQFLLFEFKTTTPGTVSPFGIKGNEFINQAAAKPPTADEMDSLSDEEKADLVPYDFSSVVNGSRITMVSSGDGESANLMIDDDITTFYQFNADDPSATLLIDLSQNYRVNSMGLTMDAGVGEIEVYTFDILPERLAAAALEDGNSVEVELDAAFFESVFPLVTQSYDEAVENTAMDLGEVDAQFALIRWIPSSDLPPGTTQPPLRIYEIKLIGLIPSGREIPLLSNSEFLDNPIFGPNPPTPPDNGSTPPGGGQVIQPAPPQTGPPA